MDTGAYLDWAVRELLRLHVLISTCRRPRRSRTRQGRDPNERAVGWAGRSGADGDQGGHPRGGVWGPDASVFRPEWWAEGEKQGGRGLGGGELSGYESFARLDEVRPDAARAGLGGGHCLVVAALVDEAG